MLDIDYGGKPYEPDIEYALPDTDDSANDALTNSIDKDEAKQYRKRCQNKCKEIRDRIFVFNKLPKGEDVVIATKQKQINFLKNALNNTLLHKEGILEDEIKEAFSKEEYNKVILLLQKEYALNKDRILFGNPGAQIALYIGIMHAKGFGIPISIPDANAWFDVAIQLGNEDTKRIANDWKTSLKEPQLSSSSDHDHSTEYSDSLLGEEAFTSGKYTDALPLLQKDYAQGGTRGGKAALYIGIMCAKGLGVQVSIPNAKAWLKVALDLGDDDTKRIAKDWMSTL